MVCLFVTPCNRVMCGYTFPWRRHRVTFPDSCRSPDAAVTAAPPASMGVIHMLIKALPLVQLTISGVMMTGTPLGLIPGPFPADMLYVRGDPTGVNKFVWGVEWFEKQGISMSESQVALLFGVCHLVAALSYWTGILESLATFCVLLMYSGILYGHSVMGDDPFVLYILIGLTVLKLLVGKPAKPAKPDVKKSKKKY